MRRTFGPTAAAGVLASAAAAWLARQDTVTTSPLGTSSTRLPAAAALALVVLAAWGAILFTRGRLRRGLVLLLVLASAALLAAAALAHAPWSPAHLGVAVAAVLALAAAVAAVVWGRDWPEMGEKYDAPGTRVRDVPDTNLDWWKALDEGHDPTSGDKP